MSIYCLSLQKKYQPKILGFGEIYEQVSVERKRKKLLKKFKNGILFLASNKDHSGRGLRLKQLENKVRKQNYKILTKGFVDSPPWQSKKRRTAGPLGKNAFIAGLAKIIFSFLVVWESRFESQKHSHMIYILAKSR